MVRFTRLKQNVYACWSINFYSCNSGGINDQHVKMRAILDTTEEYRVM